MDPEPSAELERGILIHLLEHRGHQVRFEADQWTTEFGILRSFPGLDPAAVRQALRNLEMSRWIYRRVQYVIGYSEPKLVYSLTPSGHRKAAEFTRGPGEPNGPTPVVAANPEPAPGTEVPLPAPGVGPTDGRDGAA